MRPSPLTAPLLGSLLAAAVAGCGAEDAPAPPPAADGLRGAPIDSGPRARGEPERGASPAPAAPPGGHVTGVHRRAEAFDATLEEGAPEMVGDTTRITFAHLAFGDYDPLAAAAGGASGGRGLPERLRALDGAKVAIEGFMLPMDFEEEAVRSFILSRFPPGCCFGVMPAMDQWIDVEMVNDEGAERVATGTVRVTGRLEVGELLDDYGYLTSVYRMEGESAAAQRARDL